MGLARPPRRVDRHPAECLTIRELRRSYAVSHLPFNYPLSGWIAPFIIGRDDQGGDSISDRAAFSEARAHYWLWKNQPFAADEFVAINQYRRCFWFPQLIPKSNRRLWEINRLLSINVGQPTIETTRAVYTEYIAAIEHADLTPVNEWLRGADLVVNRNLVFNVPVHQLYGYNHRKQDWEVFASVLRKRGYVDGRFNWLATHTVYIFTPELFDDYMTAWWDVVSEVYELIAPNDDPYQHRQFGFMSEWFMSMWLINLRIERPTVRVQTLPVIEGRFQDDRKPGEM